MNIKHLGSIYGGWVIDINSVQDGDTIICGGVGEDITFEEELMKYRKVNIIEIDPTQKSHVFLERKISVYENITLLKGILENSHTQSIRVYRNKNTEYVSESVFPDHHFTNTETYNPDIYSLKELINTYHPSLVKIDIEGSEYNIFKEMLGVRQICIEFHHHCIKSKTLEDTMNVIEFFTTNGYTVINNRNYTEMTFLYDN